MLRLSPPGFERFLQTPQFVATYGGGEANVAVSLAQFGLESHYVTRLPAHAIGEGAVRVLRAEGVRTEFIVRGGERIGIYYAETGASQRASTVIYDRAQSAISEMTTGTVDWAEGVRRCGVVSLDRHHAGARRARGSSDPGSARGRPQGGGGRQRRSQLPQEAVDRTTGPGDDAPADAARGRRHCQRRRHPVRARPSRRGHGRHDRDSSTSRRTTASLARSPTSWVPRRWPLPCARACRRATTAGARSSTRRRPRPSIAVSTTTCGWWIALVAGTASRAGSSSAWSPGRSVEASLEVRGRGERAQTDDSRRLQSRVGRRSRSPGRRRRQRPRADANDQSTQTGSRSRMSTTGPPRWRGLQPASAGPGRPEGRATSPTLVSPGSR